MILQALLSYYERCDGIAPLGFEFKEIPFLILINEKGHFVNLEDTRENGRGKRYLLPASKTRSGPKSYETTFLLWDHTGYLLAVPHTDPKSAKQHSTWKRMLRTLPKTVKNDPGVRAVRLFYASKTELPNLFGHPLWNEVERINNCNLTFKVAGTNDPVPCGDVIRNYASTQCGNAQNPFGRCIVSGLQGRVAKTHRDTRIGKDAKKLVGFQKNSGYDSYGKEQAFNAPVCEDVEFKYTTALNTLLKSNQHLVIGDAVTVFWSQKQCAVERQLVDVFGDPPKDDPAKGTQAVKSLFSSVKSGALEKDESGNKFFVLGLAPNSARIAVRFWIADTVPGMAGYIVSHFEDLSINHGPMEQPFLPMKRLLVSTAQLGKYENIPPNLAGELMRSILCGLPYPATLLQAVLRRIKAEQSAKTQQGKSAQNVTYPRAALIKAFINRKTRSKHPDIKEELKVSLDTENTNIGYRLGRLFAVLERLQTEANPGINATIRDKFYTSASSSPVTAFPHLMKLKGHHLSKLRKEKPHRERYFDSLLGEINDGVSPAGYPAHLPIADQGRFAIGYYHQRQEFFKSKEKNQSDEAKATEAQTEEVATS